AQRRLEVELAVQADAGRDVAEELVDRRDADRLEHRRAVVVCETEVWVTHDPRSRLTSDEPALTALRALACTRRGRAGRRPRTDRKDERGSASPRRTGPRSRAQARRRRPGSPRAPRRRAVRSRPRRL